MPGTVVNNSLTSWAATRDEKGHREYTVKFKVRVDLPGYEGPATVFATPGLFIPGTAYAIDSDVDLWAWCRPQMEIEPEVENEPCEIFTVTQHFSTVPLDRCGDLQFENPLLEPPRVSGGFVKYTEEATTDRFGNPLVNSAHEQLRGPQVEFDRNRNRVRVEMNFATAFEAITLPNLMMDCVNDSPLWGLPPRCVKLSDSTWQKLYHGFCDAYYQVSFDFDTNRETFDRVLLDEGSKVLHGHWEAVAGTGTGPVAWVLDQIGGADPDPSNPSHFDRMTDRQGNLISGPLNGAGLPAGVAVAAAARHYVSVADANTGNAVTDATKWLEVLGPLTPGAFQGGIVYAPGNLVRVNYHAGSENGSPDEVFVATAVSLNTTPTYLMTTPWLRVTPLVGRGYYSDTETYAKGNLVRHRLTEVTDVGTILVEKYHEANFLLLQIPAIL